MAADLTQFGFNHISLWYFQQQPPDDRGVITFIIFILVIIINHYRYVQVRNCCCSRLVYANYHTNSILITDTYSNRFNDNVARHMKAYNLSDSDMMAIRDAFEKFQPGVIVIIIII